MTIQRLVKVGVRLTVCIDELAASGGYLMACIADHIVCSPYAAVGSIGVVAQQPNVAERLEREGIEFITTTAGKWKRTVCVVYGPAPTSGPTSRPVSLWGENATRILSSHRLSFTPHLGRVCFHASPPCQLDKALERRAVRAYAEDTRLAHHDESVAHLCLLFHYGFCQLFGFLRPGRHTGSLGRLNGAQRCAAYTT
jgi:hypothetical protein